MKTIKLPILLVLVTILFGTTSCFHDYTISGNGIEGSEQRYARSFEGVKSSGSFDVHISNGDEFEVVVNAETNLLQYIETDVNNGKLNIRVQGFHNLRNHLPMEVYVTTPYLNEIKQSGSGTISTGYFETNHLDLALSGSGIIETAIDCKYLDAVISGSGKIYISGIADQAEFSISDSGQIEAYDLTLEDCSAHVSGSGNIFTYVDRFLNASISGSGNVFYKGSPMIESNISGSGKIIQN